MEKRTGLQALPGLRAARLRRLMTVEELTEAAGVGRHTVYLLESGRRRARLGTIRKLVSALGCGLDDLTGTVP